MITNGQLKLPSPPQGGGQMEMWARLLTDYLRQTMIRGVTGGKLKPDANFGKHLEISFPPFPIQSVPTIEGFYPFKMYQPSNLPTVGSMQPFARNFGSFQTSASLTTCQIVASGVKTSLANNPPLVSVDDAWRFWAVRWGFVEVRPNYPNSSGAYASNTFQDECTNFALNFIPVGCDFGEGQVLEGSDSDSSFAENHIVFGGNFDNNGGICLIFWVQITQDTSDTVPVSVAINAYSYTDFINGDSASIKPFNVNNNGMIPIGQVTIEDGIITPYNFVFDHMRNRYPSGNGNLISAGGHFSQGGILIPRGTASWSVQAGSGLCTPADLGSQFFYPGDGIAFKEYDASGNQLHNGIWIFTGGQPGTILNFGSSIIPDPISDANWTEWFSAKDFS